MRASTTTTLIAIGLIAALTLAAVPGQAQETRYELEQPPNCVSVYSTCYYVCVNTNASCQGDSWASVEAETHPPGADVEVCVKSNTWFLC